MTAQSVIIQQLTEEHLPVFENTVVEFRRALSAAEINWKSIGRIILKDPGLVLQTIQVLKSGSKRAASREVTDMAQAAMLLGMDKVSNLTRDLPILEKTSETKSIIGFTKAVNRAYRAACQARNWAQWKDDYAPEEVFIATFLHSLPELALWITDPHKMHTLRRRVYKDGMSPDEAHHISLGQSLQHYGRRVTEDLKLPSFLQEVLRPENARLPRVQGVNLAIQLANHVEFGWYTEKIFEILDMVAEYLNKDVEDTIRIVHGTAVNVAREAPYQSVVPAASLLALIPVGGDYQKFILEEFPDELDDDDSAPSAVQSAKPDLREVKKEINKPEAPASTTAKVKPAGVVKQNEVNENTNSTPTVCVTPQPALFSKAVKKLEAGIGKLSSSEIIRTVVHGMHEGIGFHRVVFATPTPKRPCLESRFMAGTDNDPRFNSFEVKLDQLNLFSRLLEKPASVWINDDNREKYWKLIPSEFKVFIQVNSFCAASIFVGTKPVGIFYADRHSVDCKIDKQAFHMFRHLSLLASKCMAGNTKPK